MNTYVALLRGINVGGKNKVPMADLRKHLESLGLEDVRTYIASGNIVFKSDKQPQVITDAIEELLPRVFKLDSELIKILVLSEEELQKVIHQAPQGFGTEPDKYHCDVIFLMGIGADDALKVFNPREGVDVVSRGDRAIYSQRLSSMRTRSRLSKIVGTPLYKNMTIRNWRTSQKLLEMMND